MLQRYVYRGVVFGIQLQLLKEVSIRLIITKVPAIFDRIVDVLAFLAAVILAYIMVSVSADVSTRNLLNYAIPHTLEISEYLLLFITFLSVAWVLKRDEHVKLDILVERLKPGPQSVLNITTSIVDALVCLTLTWFGTAVTWDFFQKGTPTVGVLEPPMAPIMAVIPVGCFLLSIQFLRRSYNYWRMWRAARHQDKGD